SFSFSHRSNLQPMAHAIDGANLVARLPERRDAGHGSGVMGVTKLRFSRPAGVRRRPARSVLARPLGRPLARPGAALASPAARKTSTLFVRAVRGGGAGWK